MNSLAKKQGKFGRVMVAPLKVLGKAADFYMKCMNDCNGKTGYNGALYCPLPERTNVPRSLHVDSSKQLRQLLRSVSRRRSISELMESNMYMPMQVEARRSYSVELGKIGRIDEDKPCYFEEDLLFPRAKSCAFQMNFMYY